MEFLDSVGLEALVNNIDKQFEYMESLSVSKLGDTINGDVSVTGRIFVRPNDTYDWREVLDDENYSQYVLPLSGGVLSGNVTAPKFIKKNSSDGYVLLGGGGQKAVSDFALTSDIPNLSMYMKGHSQSSTDFNNLLDIGIYRAALSNAHKPTGSNGYGNLMVVRGRNSDTLSQMYFDFGANNNVYIRSGNTGEIINRNWKTLAFTSDIPTKLSQLTDDVVAGKYLPTTIYGSFDADTLFNDGFQSGNILHQPSGNPYGIVHTLSYRGGRNNAKPDYAAQIFIPCGDDSTSPNDMFFRTSLADTWNAWNKVITDKNISNYEAGSSVWSKGLNKIPSITAGGHCVYFYSGQPALGDDINNAKEGSNAYHLWSYPVNSTDVANGRANIMNLRLQWDAAYLHDIFVSPNRDDVWHRSILNQECGPWRKFAFTDSNVASATKLQTPRKLWGNDFDGTADVNGLMYVGNEFHIEHPTTGRQLGMSPYWTILGHNNQFIGNPTYVDGRDVYIRYGNDEYASVFASNGNVGIGTTSPTAKLDVTGNVKANSFIGNASSATVLGILNRSSDLATATYGSTAGITQYSSSDNPYGGNRWYNRLKILHNNNSGYYTEFVMPFDDDLRLGYRVYNNGSLGNWKQLAFISDIPTSLPWSSITSKPTFATVATSGSYDDLSNKPTIPSSLPWSSITSKPTFATVATSGSYNDLSNKPTIANYYHTRSYSSGLQISTGTGVSNMYVPYATASQAGVVSTGDQTFAGIKTFNNELKMQGGGTYSTDIATGIACGFKVNRATINDAIVENIYLGAKDGASKSNMTLNIKKYGSISSTAPASPTTLVSINESGHVTAGGYYVWSDERIKTFGDDIKVDFDELAKLRKSHFVFNNNPTKQEIGVSAQEVQKIYPEIVNETEEGTLSVDYSKLAVVALKAIDKLYEMNKELHNRLKNLEDIIK